MAVLRQREPRVLSPAHLAWVRTLPCCVPGCTRSSVPHHIRRGTDGGMGMKPSDRWTVPICHAHHDESNHGQLTFEAKHGLDLREIAIATAAQSPAFSP